MTQLSTDELFCNRTKSAMLRDKSKKSALLSVQKYLLYLDFLYRVFLFSVHLFLYSLSTQQGFQCCTFWCEAIFFQRQINFWKTKKTNFMYLPRQLTSRRTEPTRRRLTNPPACFYLEGEFSRSLRIPLKDLFLSCWKSDIFFEELHLLTGQEGQT